MSDNIQAINCEKADDLMTERIPLSEEEKKQLEKHLQECESCRGLQAVIRWVRKKAAEESPDIPEGLLKRLQARIDTLKEQLKKENEQDHTR